MTLGSKRSHAPALRPPRHSKASQQSPLVDRFMLTYLRRELRGHIRQALLTAVGFGLGIGLVIIVSAASAAIENAQRSVLRSLYGIGTDLTITKAGGRSDAGLRENVLQPTAFGLLPSSTITKVSRLARVARATGGLQLTELGASQGGLPQPTPVAGVNPIYPALGSLASATVIAGRRLRAADRHARVAVVAADYARNNRLSVGSAITLGSTELRVVGIVSPTVAGTDIYIPLSTAQRIARSGDGSHLTNRVNVIYLQAANSAAIPAVQTEIGKLFPDTTVTSSDDLAQQVSGSLSSAATLANDLGRWVSIAALLTTVAITSLLTVSSIGRRVQEIGTLKSLGWADRRLTVQIVGELLAIGAIGAVIGLALGFAGAGLLPSIAPKLSAVVPKADGLGIATIGVHLATHVSPTASVTAIALGLAGALIAGTSGARRAAKLRPAAALAFGEPADEPIAASARGTKRFRWGHHTRVPEGQACRARRESVGRVGGVSKSWSTADA
jgi:putative ABC transport system permease protein